VANEDGRSLLLSLRLETSIILVAFIHNNYIVGIVTYEFLGSYPCYLEFASTHYKNDTQRKTSMAGFLKPSYRRAKNGKYSSEVVGGYA
jgi:hypothetical protein